MSDTFATVTAENYTGLIPAPNSSQPIFMAWVGALAAPFAALSNFCNNDLQVAFDIDTAVGVQLDQIGLWVGISRYVTVPISGVFFSWGVSGVGWGQGVWKTAAEDSGYVSALDDDHYRFLLRYKIARNNWDGRAGTALAAYNLAFTGTGVTILINDNLNMTMTVTVVNSSLLTAVQLALISGGYVDIRPMGAKLIWSLE